MTDLATIEDEIQDLQHQRGYEMLHGKPVDGLNTKITALRQKREALLDAEEVKTSLDRAADQSAYGDKVQALRQERADADAARLKARKEAETALRQFVKASQAELAHEKTIRDVTAQINRATNTKELITNVMETEKKMSMRVMSLLRTVTGHRSVFGYFQFPSTLPDPTKSWT